MKNKITIEWDEPDHPIVSLEILDLSDADDPAQNWVRHFIDYCKQVPSDVDVDSKEFRWQFATYMAAHKLILINLAYIKGDKVT